jgi:hypothetical protein
VANPLFFGSLMEFPPKANGRPGFRESAILLLRQGMVAGTTFAAIPCPS